MKLSTCFIICSTIEYSHFVQTKTVVPALHRMKKENRYNMCILSQVSHKLDTYSRAYYILLFGTLKILSLIYFHVLSTSYSLWGSRHVVFHHPLFYSTLTLLPTCSRSLEKIQCVMLPPLSRNTLEEVRPRRKYKTKGEDLGATWSHHNW